MVEVRIEVVPRWPFRLPAGKTYEALHGALLDEPPLVTGGRAERLDLDVTGPTSNPSIFDKAVSAGHDYDEQITELRREGREIALVSSGAIAEGMQRLGWTRRPSALHELQAAAAVGHRRLPAHPVHEHRRVHRHQARAAGLLRFAVRHP